MFIIISDEEKKKKTIYFESMKINEKLNKTKQNSDNKKKNQTKSFQ